MKDRMPAAGRVGRIKITNGTIQGSVVDGVFTITGIEGVFEYDDNASQEGSFYNKANVLPENVCLALGIDNDTSEPKEAFLRLNKKISEKGESTYEKIMKGRLI